MCHEDCFTSEQSVIVEASLLVLVGAHVKQVSLNGPVDEVGGKVEQHHAEHHHHDGPRPPRRPVGDHRCKTKDRLCDSRSAIPAFSISVDSLD